MTNAGIEQSRRRYHAARIEKHAKQRFASLAEKFGIPTGHSGWTAEERRLIAEAIEAGRLTRIEPGEWTK